MSFPSILVLPWQLRSYRIVVPLLLRIPQWPQNYLNTRISSQPPDLLHPFHPFGDVAPWPQTHGTHLARPLIATLSLGGVRGDRPGALRRLPSCGASADWLLPQLGAARAGRVFWSVCRVESVGELFCWIYFQKKPPRFPKYSLFVKRFLQIPCLGALGVLESTLLRILFWLGAVLFSGGQFFFGGGR